jgi:hypothetical protein
MFFFFLFFFNIIRPTCAEIGVGLTGAGCLFFVLGTMLLLDRALLTLGNILFVSGVVLIIGPMRAASFFAQPRRRKGAVCFFAGIALVLWGWTIVGMGVEAFGFVNLFGDFFPLALAIVVGARLIFFCNLGVLVPSSFWKR